MTNLARPLVRTLTTPLERDRFGRRIQPSVLWPYTKANRLRDIGRIGAVPTYSIGTGGTQRGASGNVVWRPENLVDYSEDGTQWGTGGVTVTQDGTLNDFPRYKVEDTGGNFFDKATYLSVSSAISSKYADSILIENGTSGEARIEVRDATDAASTILVYDFVNETLTVNATNAGPVLSKQATLVGDGVLIELVVEATPGNNILFGVGPQSGVVGEYVYATRAHAYRTPNASTAYVKTTGSPYYGPALTESGYLHEPQRTNKCQNFNANPQNLVTPTDAATFESNTTNMDALDAGSGALFGVIDKSTELANAGYDIGNGRVFVLDNRSGSSTALINCGGTTGNTNAHSLSIVGWVDSGDTADLTYNGEPVKAVSFTNTSPERVLNENIAPADTIKKIQVRAGPGNRVYFTLNQLEEGTTATSPIVVAGAANTRNGSAMTTTRTTTPRSWYMCARTGSLPGTKWQADDGTANNRISLIRNVSDELRFQVVNGGTTQADILLGTVADETDFAVAARFLDNDIAVSLDGGAVQTDTSATIPTATTVRDGADENDEDQDGGTIAETAIYDSALSDSDLRRLSA